MAKIGVVLSGCAGKGAYEIGCMQAIVDHFGMESIVCVGAASVGALIAQAFAIGRSEELKRAFRDIDEGKYGRYPLGFASNPEAMAAIAALLEGDNVTAFENYVSIWNLTHNSVEYIPFHSLAAEKILPYMQGAISFPIFSKGVLVDGCKYLDGAFLDNIPVHPIMDKDLDYIFCIYFDNCRYAFEAPETDRKIIKLYDFPNQRRIEVLIYEFGTYDQMYDYGYGYTKGVIERIFKSDAPEEIYQAISDYDKCSQATYKKRLTADVVLSNINTVTSRYFKSAYSRQKLASNKTKGSTIPAE